MFQPSRPKKVFRNVELSFDVEGELPSFFELFVVVILILEPRLVGVGR